MKVLITHNAKNSNGDYIQTEEEIIRDKRGWVIPSGDFPHGAPRRIAGPDKGIAFILNKIRTMKWIYYIGGNAYSDAPKYMDLLVP